MTRDEAELAPLRTIIVETHTATQNMQRELTELKADLKEGNIGICAKHSEQLDGFNTSLKRIWAVIIVWPTLLIAGLALLSQSAR